MVRNESDKFCEIYGVVVILIDFSDDLFEGMIFFFFKVFLYIHQDLFLINDIEEIKYEKVFWDSVLRN